MANTTITAEYEGSNIIVRVIGSEAYSTNQLTYNMYVMRTNGGFTSWGQDTHVPGRTISAFYNRINGSGARPYDGPADTILRGPLRVAVSFTDGVNEWVKVVNSVPITGLVPRFPGEELLPLVGVTDVTAQYFPYSAVPAS